MKFSSVALAWLIVYPAAAQDSVQTNIVAPGLVYSHYNLYGGGSTTMVLRGEVLNSPSDSTGERGVANSLQVLSARRRGK